MEDAFDQVRALHKAASDNYMVLVHLLLERNPDVDSGHRDLAQENNTHYEVVLLQLSTTSRGNVVGN